MNIFQHAAAPLAVAALAALAACSSDNAATDAGDYGGQQNVELRTRAVLDTAGLTRAPYVGAVSEQNPFVARVLAFKGNQAGIANVVWRDDLYHKGLVTYKGTGDTSFDNKVWFPASGELLVMGCYPTDLWMENGTVVYFNGSNDVMVADIVEATRTKALAGNNPRLVFNHKLCNLVVRARGDMGNWGRIVSVELCAAGADTDVPANKMRYNPADGSVGFDKPANATYGQEQDLINDDNRYVKVASSVSLWAVRPDAQTGLNVYTDDSIAYPVAFHNDRDTIVGYTMAQPIVVTNAANTPKYFFRIRTERAPQGYAIDMERGGIVVPVSNFTNMDGSTHFGSTAGRAFGIRLIFSATEVNSECIVTPWNTGSTALNDVVLNMAEDSLKIYPNNPINPWGQGNGNNY